MIESTEQIISMKEKSLEKELKIEYPITCQIDEEYELWKEKMGENMQYVKMLEGTPYVFNQRGFNEEITMFRGDWVSNALILPEKMINIDTGNEVTSFIELMAILVTGEKLPSIKVPLSQFESGRWLINSSWGLKVIFYDQSKKRIQIDSIRYLSQNIKKENIYKYTGFKEIDGKLVFLHSGGAIGTTADVKVDLEDEILSKFRFTDNEFNLKDTVKMSIDCIDVAPQKITVPLLALIFLAPLTSIIEDMGIVMGFLMWVIGAQQCKKTSLVSAFNSHYGNFDKNHSPLSFLDSVPNAIRKCNMLSGVVALCDDYFPTSNRQEAAYMKNFTEKLISLNADKMTGARSKSNGEMRKTYRAKGQIVATGELFPELSQSRMSRVFFVNIGKNDVDGVKLSRIQNNQEELQYSMKKYIEYVIENIDAVKLIIKNTFQEKTKEASQRLTYRTSEMVAGLYIGLVVFMNFVTEIGVLNKEEKQKKLNEYWETLIEVGEEQNKMVENISPLNMLLSAIEVLTNTRKLLTIDTNSVPYVKTEEFSKEGFAGFYDEKENIHIIYPDILYKAVKKFYNEQNIEFPMDKTTMCKELMNNGYLYKTEKQERPQIRRLNPRTKVNETFIGILQDKVYIMHRYNDAGTIREK